MSRIANAPIEIPQGVELNISDAQVSVKGPKGNLDLALHPSVAFAMEDGQAKVQWNDKADVAMAGTFRALLSNMIQGVSQGFEKRFVCWA